MTPGPQLQVAIEAAYDVFAADRRPGRLEAAPTRDPKRILADLTSAPLRDLTCERIGYYAGVAMTTVGDDRNYRHFLPRILELTVAGGCHYIGVEPEELARKMVYGDFPRWPRDERAAVVAVFETAWRQAIETSPDEVEAQAWLMGLVELNVVVAPLLTAWLAAPSPNAGLHLADAVGRESLRREDGREYVEPSPQALGFRSWLGGESVRERLKALLNEVDDEEVWRVEQALEARLVSH